MKLKLDYNSPVILTFAFIAAGVFFVDALVPGDLRALFTVGGQMDASQPLDWFRLVSHVIGHGSAAHLFGNFTLILLLGPIIEEKYGSLPLLGMILATALVTGVLNVALFSSGLLGASGIVFMLILLSSITNVRNGTIPLTFVLVVLLYVGRELLAMFENDGVSQFAHLLGGACGMAFGFGLERLGAKRGTKGGAKA